jgi:putative transposase
LIERGGKLAVKRQAQLLGLSRSSVYYRGRPMSARDLGLMRRIDELHLEAPFFGARKIAAQLRREGHLVGRRHVRTLMRTMGIQALYRRPRTSIPARDATVYPYLLENMAIERPDQVWSSDLTYLPMAHGFLYLMAILDIASRKVLAWRLSNTMEAGFCVEALEEALRRFGPPEIFNTDQGSQFTSEDWTTPLKAAGVAISMDGKGRWIDNIFIERLWRSLKYEDVFIKAYGSVAEARRGIGGWLSFYNEERLHQALGYQTPRAAFDGEAHEPVDNASALNGCGVAHRLVGTELKRELTHVE